MWGSNLQPRDQESNTPLTEPARHPKIAFKKKEKEKKGELIFLQVPHSSQPELYDINRSQDACVIGA